MWGSPGGISTNANRIFNQPTDVNDLQNDVQVATRLNINHTVSTKTVSFTIIMTEAWWFWSTDDTFTTNSTTVGLILEH